MRHAGGVEECRKLARTMIDSDLPFVVVMDGDYGILDRGRSYHRRVIFLRRHSIENYCAEAALVASVCRGYSEGRVEEGIVGERFVELLEQVETELTELVLLDIASRGAAEKIGPKSVVVLLSRRAPPVFDRGKIEGIVREIREKCEDRWNEAATREALGRFVANRRFVDVVKGHWVFELIRWFISGELKKVGMTMRLDDKALRMLLASKMWRGTTWEDHVRLRRCLGRAVREVKGMRFGNQ